MQLFATPENRAPAHIQCLRVHTADKTGLRAAFVSPPKPKGTVLILQGRAEFIERYFETMHDLIARGYAVATFDWRGQGGSDRVLKDQIKGHINDFSEFDADLDAIYSRVLVAHCPKPYFALAHSTGGLVLLRSLRGKKWLERAVITSPLLGFRYGRWPRAIARGLALGVPAIGLGAANLPGFSKWPLKREYFDNNVLTSSRKRWDRDITTIEQYHELVTGAPTYGWLRAAILSTDEIMAWPRRRGPSCPTLIAMAGLDRVVDNDSTKAFTERVPGFSLFTIADSRHEILNEKDNIRQHFLAAMQAFLTGT
jgi:lysophospholipase